MNKKLFGSMVVTAAMLTGYSAYDAQNNKELSDAVLANVEALAQSREDGGVTHTLECGNPGIKMCEATCGRCNMTMKSWGNGGTVKVTCSLK